MEFLRWTNRNLSSIRCLSAEVSALPYRTTPTHSGKHPNKFRQKNLLRDGEERFQQLAESIHEVFWICTAEKLHFLYVSPAYEKIWGRSCQSLYEDLNSPA